MDSAELVRHLRSRADEYENQGSAALTLEARDALQKTATTYRRLADRIEATPPRWLASRVQGPLAEA
jgi:hypothetical protein